MPNIIVAGNSFFEDSINPHRIVMPNIERLGNNCFTYILSNLQKLSMPKLKKTGDYFLSDTLLKELMKKIYQNNEEKLEKIKQEKSNKINEKITLCRIKMILNA